MRLRLVRRELLYSGRAIKGGLGGLVMLAFFLLLALFFEGR